MSSINVAILDFEDVNTLEESVIRNVKLDYGGFTEFINNWFPDSSVDILPERQIYNSLVSKNLLKTNLHLECTWFHFTRLLSGTECQISRNGLLPVPFALERIWHDLDSINDGIDVDMMQLKDAAYQSSRFQNKLMNECNWGPYGTLFRDIADFDLSNFGYYNYFRMPEIITDIFSAGVGLPGIELLREKYIQKSVPLVVKIHHERDSIKYIGNAVYFLYLYKVNNESFVDCLRRANTFIDFKGQIDPSKIIYCKKLIS
ncbi:Uncharacterised protein [Sphingobacterium multivorum]|uniref:hypothetical protein n=1 Tax=Sphingobacterium TaxID=28453 RepID=UPI00096466F4|nr:MULTISPECIES: hypothetical protein [Sphingobacterium]OJY99223.1 MAG: hypothetical protein BGP15_07510 [Sphingobacterium sp. 40-24]QQT47179.1 hypothetical protein I6J00_11185 [Sphingobacterium multivorum]SUJ13378.1 Uncharacterised protein [Sphingobacterium multivorum]